MYNRAAAVAYARAWALSRNPRFFNFEGMGGDCTNFVSQCLLAGGLPMNMTPTFGWYFLSSGNRTPSWSGVEYFYNFLISNAANGGTGPRGRLCKIEELEIGDVVQLSFRSGIWAHNLIVTEISDVAAVAAEGTILQGAAVSEPFAGRILIATHTVDSLDRPLNSYIYERARYIKVS